MNPNIKLKAYDVNGFRGGLDLEYVYSKFPGGEIHVKVLLPVCKEVTISASITNSDDLMAVLLLNNAIKNQDKNVKIFLHLKYIPYQQQDRICETGEALSIKLFADLINSCGFERVDVYDPHSDVATALINNCRIYGIEKILDFVNMQEFFSISKIWDVDIIVAPDAGSYKKVSKFSVGVGIPIVHATKDRVKGEVQKVTLHGDVAGKRCLVVDDICVGGRTFTELGKALKDARADKLYLYVTHGIFSKGIDELKTYYEEIYCTDSRPEAEVLGKEKKVTIIER